MAEIAALLVDGQPGQVTGSRHRSLNNPILGNSYLPGQLKRRIEQPDNPFHWQERPCHQSPLRAIPNRSLAMPECIDFPKDSVHEDDNLTDCMVRQQEPLLTYTCRPPIRTGIHR